MRFIIFGGLKTKHLYLIQCFIFEQYMISYYSNLPAISNSFTMWFKLCVNNTEVIESRVEYLL